MADAFALNSVSTGWRSRTMSLSGAALSAEVAAKLATKKIPPVMRAAPRERPFMEPPFDLKMTIVIVLTLNGTRHIFCQEGSKETHMRVSREKAAENRERIVDTAARLFREKGFDGVGIDAIMSGAGLTHGGFYGHFGSKDDLATETVLRALQRSAESQSRFTNLGDLVSDYLSERHRADRANGCPIAALGADIARQGAGIRRGLTAHLRAYLNRVAQLLRGGTASSRRKRAI